MTIDRRFWLLTSLSFWAVSAYALESGGCPTLSHGYGPYDYRTITKEQILLVEGAHFFPNVENLRDGTPHPNRGYPIVPGGEIDYTLRAFPNHHRALMALSRLSIRDKTERPKGVKANVDCYFKAAMDFREDDSYVYLLYGIHLSKKGRISEALEYFDKAKSLGDDSANLHYNLGLAYFQAKRFEESLMAAHKAYKAGFPLDGLKRMLIRAGKWRDAPVIVDDSGGVVEGN
jgi:tetratricopeptide (TPR) repeat protein